MPRAALIIAASAILTSACVPDGTLGHRIAEQALPLTKDGGVIAEDVNAVSRDIGFYYPDAVIIDAGFDDSGQPIDIGIIDVGFIDVGMLDFGFPDSGVAPPDSGPEKPDIGFPADMGFGPPDIGFDPPDMGFDPPDLGFPDADPPDTGGFQDAAGVGPDYTAGPLAPADLGDAPAGCSALASVDIQNDTDAPRPDDLAHAGFPIGRALNLTSADELVVIGPGERRLQAQFHPISRWGDGPAAATAPIKWLDLSVKANVPPRTTVNYSVRRCPGLAAVNDPMAVTVSSQGDRHTIATGVATFVVDESNPAVFESMALGGATVYTHGAGAGARIVDVQGNVLATHIAANDFFSIEQRGPVKAVVTRTGHFTLAPSYQGCGVEPSFSVRFTFVRGSGQVGVDLDVINECGDGFTRPFSGLFEVREVSWRFPFTVEAQSQTRFATGVAGAVHRTSATSMTIEQQVGATGNGISPWRQARIVDGTNTVDRAEYYPAPTIGVGDDNFIAIAQLAKMKYREPQALVAEDGVVSIEVLSQPLRIGEAQGIWAFARLELLQPGLTDSAIATARDRGIADLERGLLVHPPPDYTNEAGVLARLPTSNNGALMASYLGLLNQIHEATVREGGQWDLTKNYGMFTWPDYKFDSWRRTLATPLDYTPKSNYWSASSSELKQWWVDGDPRWVWDFAFWQEHHLYRAITYNLGLRTPDVPENQRSGFGVGDGRVNGSYPANGYRYRTGIGSDDYFYNMANLYIVRPSGSLRDAHWRGASSFINRYSVPRSDQANRDHFLNAVRIDRGEMQHLNSIRYAAEFVRRDNAAFQTKLDEFMDELAQDNFIGGVICPNDLGNENSCTTGQAFMYSALHLDTFREILNHWGEYRGRFKGAITGYARQFYEASVTKNGNNIDFGPQWSKNLACTFNGGQLVSCSGTTQGERLFDQEKPMHVSMMLIADDIDPSIDLCGPCSRAFPSALQLSSWRNFFSRDGGWAKVPSQVMRDIVHGIALTEYCPQRTGGTPGPYGATP